MNMEVDKMADMVVDMEVDEVLGKLADNWLTWRLTRGPTRLP